MDIQNRLTKLLTKISLTTREQEVFLELAKSGPSTLKELILKTKLKKPTVYRVITDLETKRLVFSDNKKYEKTYTAHGLKRLLSYLSNERRKMHRLELEIEEIIPQFNVLFKGGAQKPKVEIYQTKEGYETVANLSLECKEKKILYIGSIENILAILGKNYDHEYYIPTRIKREKAYLLLTHDTPLMREYRRKDKNQNRETRFLTRTMKMETAIMIFDDTVTFLSKPEEMLALAVTSPSIATTMKLIFNNLWSHAAM